MSVDVIDEEKEKTSMMTLRSKMKDRYKTDFWHKNKEKNLEIDLPDEDDYVDVSILKDEPKLVEDEVAHYLKEVETDVALQDVPRETTHSILEVDATHGGRGFGEGDF